ncbi:hypothetical protein [Stappia sp.]
MAGHSDARLVMFGSSVTGFSYRSGTSFDTGGRSDTISPSSARNCSPQL